MVLRSGDQDQKLLLFLPAFSHPWAVCYSLSILDLDGKGSWRGMGVVFIGLFDPEIAC